MIEVIEEHKNCTVLVERAVIKNADGRGLCDAVKDFIKED